MDNNRKIISVKLKWEELEEIEKRRKKFIEEKGIEVSRHWFMKSLLLDRFVGAPRAVRRKK